MEQAHPGREPLIDMSDPANVTAVIVTFFVATMIIVAIAIAIMAPNEWQWPF